MTAYYEDPNFLAGIKSARQPGGVFRSPFAGTQQAIASRLFDSSMTDVNTQLALAKAGATRRASLFDAGLAYNNRLNDINRSARRISAEENIAFREREAAAERAARKKSLRRGLFAKGLGLAAGGAGFLAGGGPTGFMAGNTVGQTVGSLF